MKGREGGPSRPLRRVHLRRFGPSLGGMKGRGGRAIATPPSRLLRRVHLRRFGSIGGRFIGGGGVHGGCRPGSLAAFACASTSTTGGGSVDGRGCGWWTYLSMAVARVRTRLRHRRLLCRPGSYRGSHPRVSPGCPRTRPYSRARTAREITRMPRRTRLLTSARRGREGRRRGDESAFVDLRTLMVATDWSDKDAMGELAIAGQARALLEWHSMAKFCGACGAKDVPTEAGRRKQCSNESCKKRIYPRVDPVVIMLVIDKENDRALLSRQSRFVPRMWSCLAGFIVGEEEVIGGEGPKGGTACCLWKGSEQIYGCTFHTRKTLCS